MWDDAELLAALKKGDDEAWDEAFRRLYPCAFAAACHPLASLTPTEAEDIAIEALTLLLPKIAKMASFGELRPLVITIASRRAISEKRRQLADKRGAGEVGSLDALMEDETRRFEPAEQLLGHLPPGDLRDLARLLQVALDDLEPRDAAVLREFILERQSYKEIAAGHGMPIGSVGVVLARSLDKVRARLAAQPTLWKELSSFLR